MDCPIFLINGALRRSTRVIICNFLPVSSVFVYVKSSTKGQPENPPTAVSETIAMTAQIFKDAIAMTSQSFKNAIPALKRVTFQIVHGLYSLLVHLPFLL